MIRATPPVVFHGTVESNEGVFMAATIPDFLFLDTVVPGRFDDDIPLTGVRGLKDSAVTRDSWFMWSFLARHYGFSPATPFQCE